MTRVEDPGVRLGRFVFMAAALVALIGLSLVGYRWWKSYTPACTDGPAGLKVCVASDAQKVGLNQKFALEPSVFDPNQPLIKLSGARNEVLAFQIILRGLTRLEPTTVSVTDLESDSGAHVISADAIKRFFAFYHWVSPGGHTWGTPSDVLDWPHYYPDALVPLAPLCHQQPPPQEHIPISDKKDRLVWVDLYIPDLTPPGVYRGQVSVSIAEHNKDIPVELTVYPATIPHRTHIHAVGELYKTYRQEGAGKDFKTSQWRAMSQCYQQLAHRHRVVFTERLGGVVFPDDEDEWEPYVKNFGPALNGSLFTDAYGYAGPGLGIPISAWRVPWPQTINGRVKEPISAKRLARMRRLAKGWAARVDQNDWHNTYFFAYVFDEIDGPTDEDAALDAGRSYLVMAHDQMRRVQQAFDEGAGGRLIDLMWTSHSNPLQWYGDKELDLTGVIRLWTPNAAAADVDFLKFRTLAGEQAWIYHSGHPYVGLHVINGRGIEMRTWGVIAARYGLTGHLMWAVNFGMFDNPYRKPSYKSADDRFGNGTFVYPGNMLDTIGLPARPGPVPSIRLKAWRRGLQDFELIRLARLAGHEDEVEQLVRSLVPAALAEGRGAASWPDDPEVWHSFHRRLLELASP